MQVFRLKTINTMQYFLKSAKVHIRLDEIRIKHQMIHTKTKVTSYFNIYIYIYIYMLILYCRECPCAKDVC